MSYIGKKVIVRGEYSGVYFGTLAQLEGRQVKLTNVRNIWYWEGAASTMQIATNGVDQLASKVTVALDSIVLLDAIAILPCTTVAVENLESTPVWKN